MNDDARSELINDIQKWARSLLDPVVQSGDGVVTISGVCKDTLDRTGNDYARYTVWPTYVRVHDAYAGDATFYISITLKELVKIALEAGAMHCPQKSRETN
jgi:hypothetical protein